MHGNINRNQEIEISLDELRETMKRRIVQKLDSSESYIFVPENTDDFIDHFNLGGEINKKIADQNETNIYSIVSQAIDELIDEKQIKFGAHHIGRPYSDPYLRDSLSGKEIILRKTISAPAWTAIDE